MKRHLTLLLVALSLVALVLAAAGCGGDGSTTTTAGSGTTGSSDAGAGGAVDGEALFNATCTPCHGEGGVGGQGPDLRGLSDADVQRVKDQITNGAGAMPAFGGTLTPEQIDAIAVHVVALQ